MRRLQLFSSSIQSPVSSILVALLVLAATWVGFQSGAPVRMPAIFDLPGHTLGLNNLEQSERGAFRWTDGDTSLCALQAGWSARSAAEVTIAGDYALALGNSTATLQLAGSTPLTIELAPGLRRYTILGAAQHGPDLCLRIGGSVVADPNNNRSLGVPFYNATLRQLPAAGPVTPAAGQLLLNLALALGMLWLARTLGAPPWAAGLTVAGGVLLFGVAPWVIPPGAGLFSYTLPVAGGLLGALAGTLGARALARRAPGIPLLARDLLGMAYWSLLLVGGVWALQRVNGHHGVWPLKAGVDPTWSWWALLPTALFVGWAWLVVRGLGHREAGRREQATSDDRQPTPRGWPLVIRPWSFVLRSARSAHILHPSFFIPCLLVLVGAVVLPVALEAAVLGWDALYALFRDSPYEYQRDTYLVGGDPIGFLRRYVELAPTMALHTSTHPPGSVLLLWAVEGLFGPGAVATSWTAILLSALAALAAIWLGWHLGGARLGLAAGAIYVVMPGHMIFSVTSMDGIFNAINALGAVAFFLCLEPGARWRGAVAAGLLIALGLFFTYTSTQLFFFGVAAVALATYRRATSPSSGTPRSPRLSPLLHGAPMVSQGLIAAITIVAIYLLIFLVTGFNVVVAAQEATAENAIVVGKQLVEGPSRGPFLPPSLAYYVDFLGANAAAYLWYLAPWGLAALSAAIVGGAVGRWAGLDALDALLIASAFCVLGMLLAGLFNREIERIWAFTYPLLAVPIARHALRGDPATQRWRLGLILALFFAMSAVIKQLLNTAW